MKQSVHTMTLGMISKHPLDNGHPTPLLFIHGITG